MGKKRNMTFEKCYVAMDVCLRKNKIYACDFLSKFDTQNGDVNWIIKHNIDDNDELKMKLRIKCVGGCL